MARAVECLIDEATIRSRVAEIARTISRDFAGQPDPLVIGVLAGAWIFMADLVRCFDFDLSCDFVRLSSYGSAAKSSGLVTLAHKPSAVFKARHILIVEDVVDTGRTARWLREYFESQAASVRFCTLLDKPQCRKTEVVLDYVGFTVPDRFVVGYGIDYAESYRNLPYIGALPDRRDGEQSGST